MAITTLRGVMAGFLGTLWSRSSEIDGYWMFGFVVAADSRQHIDLLGHIEQPARARDALEGLAQRKFR